MAHQAIYLEMSASNKADTPWSLSVMWILVSHPDGVLDMPEEVISHVGVDAKLIAMSWQLQLHWYLASGDLKMPLDFILTFDEREESTSSRN